MPIEKSKISNMKIVILLINYFLGYNFIYPLIFEKKDFLAFLIPLLITLFIMYPVFKEEVIKFKNNYKNNLKYTILYFLGMIGLEIVVSLLMSLFVKQDSGNQKEIELLATTNLPLVIFSGLVFGPIVEEVIFRYICFKKVKESKGFTIALITSSILFGLMHVYAYILLGDFSQLIYILYYGFMGAVLALIYRKTDNLLCSILMHFLNNLVAILLII